MNNEKSHNIPLEKECETLLSDPIKSNAPLTNKIKEKKSLLYNLIRKQKKGKDNIEKEDKQRIIEINKNINNYNQHTNTKNEIKYVKGINNNTQNSNHNGKKKKKKN